MIFLYILIQIFVELLEAHLFLEFTYVAQGHLLIIRWAIARPRLRGWPVARITVVRLILLLIRLHIIIYFTLTFLSLFSFLHIFWIFLNFTSGCKWAASSVVFHLKFNLIFFISRPFTTSSWSMFFCFLGYLTLDFFT